jgi:predicted metal-binding protein
MLTQYEKLRAVEKEIAAEPIFEYAYLRTENLKFSERVRDICREECPRYNKSWSCPPAVGTVDECRARALGYKDCFVFTTIAELDNPTDMAEALESRSEHQKVTVKVSKIFEKYYGQVLTLSVESCSLCDKCTYPEKGCRWPDRMLPCVEGYGLLVTELAEKGGMSFHQGRGTVTWFSVVFYNAVP